MKNQILIRSHCQIANILLTGLPLCSGEVFFMKKEIWKPVKNYEGIYEVSNLGRVKSLSRIILRRGKYPFLSNERILKPGISSNAYLTVFLSFNTVQKSHLIHQLVAEAFLNHKPNGHKLVCNHIDFNRLNNHVDNLEIVTNRVNTNQKHLKSSSQYIGVNWDKKAKKWRASIKINCKTKFLGLFKSELEASKAYQNELKKIQPAAIIKIYFCIK